MYLNSNRVDSVHVRNLFKKRREQLNISLESMDKILGRSNGYTRNIELGLFTLKRHTIVSFCKVLKLDSKSVLEFLNNPDGVESRNFSVNSDLIVEINEILSHFSNEQLFTILCKCNELRVLECVK